MTSTSTSSTGTTTTRTTATRMTSTRTTRRHLTACAALATALVLSACGSGDDSATTAAATSARPSSAPSASAPSASAPSASAPSASSPADSAKGNDADVTFLTGMEPHHEQAVEMSDLVLAADPPAAVAAIARKIKSEQAPEIEQMTTMLADLGKPVAAHGGGMGMGGHEGMMSEADMSALETATGTDAARLYLEGMVEHHQGAIQASEAELADGSYGPARTLATSIARAQSAEIPTMRTLLAGL